MTRGCLPATTRGYSSCWSPDGAALAIGSQDGVLEGWRRHDRFARVPLGGWVSALSWAHDGTALAAAAGRAVVLFDQQAARRSQDWFLPGHVNDLAWDRVSARLAVATQGGIAWYAPQEHDEQVAFAPSVGTVVALALSPWTGAVAGGKLNGSVVLWALGDGTGVCLTGYDGAVGNVCFRPGGGQLVVGGPGEVTVWAMGRDGRPCGMEPLVLERFDGLTAGLGYHPFLPLLACGGGQGEVNLWSVDAPAHQLSSVQVHEEISVLAWNPCGDSVAVGTAGGRVLCLELAG